LLLLLPPPKYQGNAIRDTLWETNVPALHHNQGFAKTSQFSPSKVETTSGQGTVTANLCNGVAATLLIGQSIAWKLTIVAI
jgi:hypothetical protein